MAETHPPAEYIVARLREVLANDERTNVLDIHLRLAAEKMFLTGRVESEERRRRIELVARENVPEGIEVVNQIELAFYGPPQTETVG